MGKHAACKSVTECERYVSSEWSGAFNRERCCYVVINRAVFTVLTLIIRVVSVQGVNSVLEEGFEEYQLFIMSLFHFIL